MAGALAQLRQFSRAFWVINGIELLERGAYYSTSAVLTLYMTTALHLSASAAGGILALLLFLLYAVPLVAAALSDKFGYRASLIVAFALLTSGYFALLSSNGVALVFLAVALIGFGAGIFKPIAAALVGQTTTDDQRNFAYILYYGAINIGAFVFPLTVGIIGGTHPGDIVFLARTAFIAAVALAGINITLSLTIFRNIKQPQRDVQVFAALKKLGGIFRDPKFLVLLVIYTGFWFMYATSLSFITQYMKDYVAAPAWFNAAIQQSINPLIIIMCAPLVGIFTKRIPSLALMSIGIGLYVIGFIVVGSTGLFAPFLVGIAIFSFGELLTHPSFLSYVSKIAPPDRMAVYMSYGFIPIAIGLPLGSGIGGVLYDTFGATGHPKMFWAILAAVGLVSIAALLIYNQVIARSSTQAVAPRFAPGGTKRGGSMVGLALAVVALLLVPAVIGAAAFSSKSDTLTSSSLPALGTTAALGAVKLTDDTQKLACGKEYTKKVTLPSNASGNATFSVTFTTPGPSNGASSTTPDSYELHITPPSGVMTGSQPATKSPVTTSTPATPGDYTVTVKLAKCGGETLMGPLGILPAGQTTRSEGSFTLGGSYQTAK
ncbi:MAG: MFS transporter [Candidatus Thermoplasmatota archaeon]